MRHVPLELKDGRKLVNTEEAARHFGIGESYIRKLWHERQVTRVEQSKKRVFYFLEELERVLKEKAATRKQRGGRPRRDR